MNENVRFVTRSVSNQSVVDQTLKHRKGNCISYVYKVCNLHEINCSREISYSLNIALEPERGFGWNEASRRQVVRLRWARLQKTKARAVAKSSKHGAAQYNEPGIQHCFHNIFWVRINFQFFYAPETAPRHLRLKTRNEKVLQFCSQCTCMKENRVHNLYEIIYVHKR